MVSGLASRVPRGGDPERRRLRRVHDRRRVRPHRAQRVRHDLRASECVPAPRHSASPRGSGPRRRRVVPLPVPRVALRARRPSRRDRRRSRLPHSIPDDLALCTVRAERGAGSCSSTSTWTRSRCSTSSIRCPKLFDPYHFDQMKFRSVPHHGDTGELEGRRRRVQRGVPRADRPTNRCCRGPTM